MAPTLVRNALAGLLTAVLVQAQAAWAEDLLSLYELARSADPELRSIDYEHQASREILTQAKSGYLPAVKLAYDHTETEQRIRDSDNVLFQAGRQDFNTDAIVLSLTQPVFRYANYVRIKQARSELKQADANLARAEQDLILRVAEAYLEALAAQDNVGYLEAERSALERQLTLAEARERAQIGRTADRLEAEARLAGVAADHAEAKVHLHDTYEGIFELTGEFPQALATLRQEFPLSRPDPFDVEHWLTAAETQNWEIETQRQAVEVARQEVKRQQAGHYPTVDLELRESLRDQGGTVFGGGSQVENRDVMISFNMPLYLGGSVSSRHREAAYRHQAEIENLIRIQRRVRRDTQKTFSAIVNSIARIEARHKEVLAQSEVLKLKRGGYEAALYSNLSVLDAERDLYSAKRDYAAARYEYLLNGLRLKGVVGTLSEADLATANRWLAAGDAP
ncbi:MAG: TolC family outer membrane protein [Gammaproteobacteria bacterium]